MKPGHNIAIGGGGFHHVALKVHDYEKTVTFYTEGLGFKPTFSWGEDGHWAGKEDSRGVLLDTGDGNYLEVFGGGPKRDPEAATDSPVTHFALRTLNTDAALERARTAGGLVTMEPTDVPVHGETLLTFRVAFVKGPSGELFEFFQNSEL